MVKRQRFTAEFKREAVRLLDAGERPTSEVAIDCCRPEFVPDTFSPPTTI